MNARRGIRTWKQWAAALMFVAGVAGLARGAGAAPTPPTLTVFDNPELFAYVKIAPIDAVLNKMEAYANQVAPDSIEAGELASQVAEALMDPQGEHADLSKGASIFFYLVNNEPRFVSYVPLKPGAGAIYQDNPGARLLSDAVLIADQPDPAILDKAAANAADFQLINDEAPLADIRAALNMAPLQPMLESQINELKASMMGAGDSVKFLDYFTQVGAAGLDVQLGRQGVELQTNVFPVKDTPLAALCAQPPADAFPLLAFLPRKGAIIAAWRIAVPETAEAFEPDGAAESLFPGKGFQSQLRIQVVKDAAAADQKTMADLQNMATQAGGDFNAAFTAGARTVEGEPVHRLDMKALMAGGPMASMASMLGDMPPLEICRFDKYTVHAMGDGVIDEAILNIKSGQTQAEPLVAQSVYPGRMHMYADIHLDRLFSAFQSMLEMFAPMGAIAPDGGFGDVNAPPICAAADLSDGAGQFRLFVPVATVKAWADKIEEMGLGAGSPYMPANACQENLMKIDGAKEQWALETRSQAGATPAWEDLIGETLYIRTMPECPDGGTYTINPVGEDPTCTIPGHALPGINDSMGASAPSASAAPDFTSMSPEQKVIRAKSDMRSMATALEAFYIDNNQYPPSTADHSLSIFGAAPGGASVHAFQSLSPANPMTLTTPLAYMTGFPTDPFSPGAAYTYSYYSTGQGWMLYSPGPDGVYDMDVSKYDPLAPQPTEEILTLYTYDPTNGAVSGGDVYRLKQ